MAGDETANALLRKILENQHGSADRHEKVLAEVQSIRGNVVTLTSDMRRFEKDLSEVKAEVAKNRETVAENELEQVKRERDELKSSKTHWFRYVVTALVSLATGGILLAIGRLLH